MSSHTGAAFEAVVSLDRLDAPAIAEACVQVAELAGIPSGSIELYGRALSLKRMQKEVRTRGSFVLHAGTFEAHFSTIAGGYRVGYLTVKGAGTAPLERCAEMVADASTLISARWVDAEYDHWQNAEDPQSYAFSGRSMEGLPMRNNELPPPLNQMVVDTSRNPGRVVLRDGYVEAVGYRMWLGDEFFKRVPSVTHEQVRTCSWLRVVDRGAGVLEILAADEPFRDAGTAELQRRLRLLLFPTTAGLRSTKQGRPISN